MTNKQYTRNVVISKPIECRCVYLGSKRGVMRGVDPSSKEQSIMFLAGVTSGFLLDLQYSTNHHRCIASVALDAVTLHTGVSGQTRWNTKYQCGATRDKDSTDRLTDAFWLQTPIALALFVVVGFFAVLPLKDKSISDEWNWHAAFVIN